MKESSPTIFRIATTGHRFIYVDDRLSTSIRSVLDWIIQERGNTELHLLCALAEGSDQLVADLALSYKDIKLIVPLPMSEEKYLQSFTSEIGKKSFNKLKQNADNVFTLPEQADDETAYECLGKYLLDNSNALIALWNGEHSSKRGGTGELATKAIQMGKLIYWIYADNGNEDVETRRKAYRKPGDVEIIGGRENSPAG